MQAVHIDLFVNAHAKLVEACGLMSSYLEDNPPYNTLESTLRPSWQTLSPSLAIVQTEDEKAAP